MEDINQILNSILRNNLWDKLNIMQINGDSYKNHLYDMEEKYVEPVEHFIYSIPYGASYISHHFLLNYHNHQDYERYKG